jgi:uncharacterized RDD family membrane protein YckC
MENILDLPTHPASPTTNYPSFKKRALAFAVDFVFLLIIEIFLALLPFYNHLLILLVSWIYFALAESSEWQGSIGKKLLSMQVTNLKSEKISITTATIRFCIKCFSVLILCIGCLVALFTPARRSLHDLLSQTVVINENGKPARREF